MYHLSHECPKSALLSGRISPRLLLLLLFHIIACCVSLTYVAEIYAAPNLIAFDATRIAAAALNVAPFVLILPLLAFSRFSFGYFLSFYFYTAILGYFWLIEFSAFHYDHKVPAISAFVSALAFFVPAIFVTSPIKQRFVLSARALDILLIIILALAAVTVAVGAFYNFRLVGIAHIYNFRDDLQFPGFMRYALGIVPNALLPFAYACFFSRRSVWGACAALLLILLLYPISLTKLTLFAPFWLLFLTLLSRLFEPRTSVVLSLSLPITVGVILVLLFKAELLSYETITGYFGAINFRMVALPSVALDAYNDFFSTHPTTHFCQILFLKPFVHCPYSDPLSIVMAKTYSIGNLNASLFASEGIASVGPILAPLAALGCGLAISLCNRLSSGLPARFVLLSGGILPQTFLNVPFSTTLLSNGAVILFFLWYITPRAIFELNQTTETRSVEA